MSAAALNHYEILGISPEADAEAIRAAYFARLEAFRERLTAPQPDDGERLVQLRQAFATLSDAGRRAAYDAWLFPAASRPPSAPAQPAAIPAASSVPADRERLQFTGSGSEYFRIWIVNLLLSIVTLGFYSAWAKVRREQYFHRNLQLAGAAFAYHGEPWAILKGRGIALAALMGLSLAQSMGPLAYGVAICGFALAMPWLMIRAFRFRAFNTSYRGLRFGFAASYGEACRVFLGYGLLALVTLGLAFPLFYRRLRTFVIDHLRYGTTPFSCAVGVGVIYRIFVTPGLLTVAALSTLLLFAAPLLAAGTAGKVAFSGLLALLPLALYLFVLAYVPARTANAVWSASRLGEHRLQCDLPVAGYLAVVVGNWLLIVATLGLAIPWARVRMARFRAEHFALAVSGSLDDFVTSEQARVAALGDEASELFDLDVSL